jgi:hypothetical protein
MLKSIRWRFLWLCCDLADGGYAGQKLRDAIACHGDWINEVIKRSDAVQGFEIHQPNEHHNSICRSFNIQSATAATISGAASARQKYGRDQPAAINKPAA